MDSILNKLMQNELWNRIVKEDTIAVYLGGSQQLGITDENSDYDLIEVSPSGDNLVRRKEYIVCDGKKIHWYNFTPDFILNIHEKSHVLLMIGNSTLNHLKESDILYLNESQREVWNTIWYNRESLAIQAARILAEKYKWFIYKIATQGQVQEENHMKMLYHLCVASYTLTGEPMTDQVKIHLGELKRIFNKIVCEECKQLCVERMQILNQILGTQHS